MLPPRILGLLVILLAVQGLCKPTKSTENEDYEDDLPVDEEDEFDEDAEDADNLGVTSPPPQILSSPMSVRVTEGNTAMLPCNVIYAENYAVTWMKDKEYLYVDADPHTPDKERIVRLPNNTLVIYNASLSDSSNNYQCTILLKEHIVLTHRLLVDPKGPQSVAVPQQPPQQPTMPPQPAIPSQHSHRGLIHVIPKKKINIDQGKSITFGCEINSTLIQPSPEIKWFVENKKLNKYDPDVVVNGNYITIKKVNKSHSGRYQCLAEDGSKTPSMEAITLVVHYAPEVEVKRSTVHSGLGIESEMTCIVSANPRAIIKWYKDNKEITEKKGYVMHHGEMKGNRTKHVLKILQTVEQDFGEYKCSAQNSIGQNHKLIKLTGAPSQAKMLSANMTTDDTGIILKWRLESYSPINEYKLQYRRKGEIDWNIIMPEVKNGKGNQFIVEHPIEVLQPGSYEAILIARNSFGWSPPSDPHYFTGDYPPEMARKEENSAAIQIRPPGIFLALILVVLSCAFTSL